MKKVNENEMRNTEGGWYFGKVYCYICGKDVSKKVSYVDRVIFGKDYLSYRYSGITKIDGTHYH